MNSRLEGSLSDFIFMESPKVTLPIKKSERGTHIKLVTVHRGGKTFKRKQRVGRKEKDKGEVKKSLLHSDNLQGIDDLNESGIVGLVGGMHESETYICRFKDGSQAIHKTMMTGDIVGEVGAYETSKILDWDVVPETIQCDYGKGEGSCQKWIPNSMEPTGDFMDGEVLGEKHLDDLSKIFVMDMILGNFDRHEGNIVIDKNDKVWAIDNEMWGKKANAELHIENLENLSKSTFFGANVPMLRILERSFGVNTPMWINFKDHVDKNIDIMLNKKDEIIKYWLQYKDSNIKAGAVPVNEAIDYIKRNIKYLEDYRGK